MSPRSGAAPARCIVTLPSVNTSSPSLRWVAGAAGGAAVDGVEIPVWGAAGDGVVTGAGVDAAGVDGAALAEDGVFAAGTASGAGAAFVVLAAGSTGPAGGLGLNVSWTTLADGGLSGTMAAVPAGTVSAFEPPHDIASSRPASATHAKPAT